MRKAAARRYEVTLSACSVTRLLIVSYFMGLGLGFVDGAKVSTLFMSFMPEIASEYLSRAIVICLAAFVLVPYCRRAAALLLAVVIFWASYLTMMVQPGHEQIAGFWRDLALIGALLLTYGSGRNKLRIDGTKAVDVIQSRVTALFSRSRTDPEEIDAMAIQRPDPQAPSSAAHPKRMRTELYRQDFEVVRVL